MAAHPTTKPPSQPAWARGLASLGEPVFFIVNTIKEIFEVFALTLYYLFRARRSAASVFEQMHEVGNRSVVFVAVTLGF
jgi:phospholipid/cholesterol/gamma-HCH transport system permease protein